MIKPFTIVYALLFLSKISKITTTYNYWRFIISKQNYHEYSTCIIALNHAHSHKILHAIQKTALGKTQRVKCCRRYILIHTTPITQFACQTISPVISQYIN